MAPVDLKIIIPHAEEGDIAFLLSLLQLDPKKRITAANAKNSLYFRTLPLPCPLSELPVPSRGCHTNKSVSCILKKDESVADYLHGFLA